MTEKEEKLAAKESVVSENEVDELVRKWIAQNPPEFTVNGISGSRQLRYRKRVLERCKQYKNAPDEYLKTMLKTLPENIKWYFNVLQTVLVTGLVGFLATLTVLTCSNLITWLQKLFKTTVPPVSDFNEFLVLAQASFADWVTWVFPASVLAIVFYLALKTHEATGSSWLSYIIQHKFKIAHNLTELKIEMYYVSKIIEIRTKQKEFEGKSPVDQRTC
jgi:hypothetical protein